MTIPALPHILIEPIIRNALLEDLGLAGDITTNAVIDENHHSKVAMVSRETGILSGVDIASMAFTLINPLVNVDLKKKDGDILKPGDVIAIIEGSSRAILTGERTALNFMSHLSGIASVTHKIVKSIEGTKTQVVCTRKTTPRKTLEQAKKNAGHMVKIEIEVDTLDQLKEVMALGVDAVLLDNMDPETLKEAVAIVNQRAITEASGRINPDTARIIAESGVDLISVGWITHSAPILDIGLDFIS